MAMNITTDGIDWTRLTDDGFDELAPFVTAAATDACVACARPAGHFVNLAGQTVCPEKAFRALWSYSAGQVQGKRGDALRNATRAGRKAAEYVVAEEVAA